MLLKKKSYIDIFNSNFLCNLLLIVITHYQRWLFQFSSSLRRMRRPNINDTHPFSFCLKHKTVYEETRQDGHFDFILRARVRLSLKKGKENWIRLNSPSSSTDCGWHQGLVLKNTGPNARDCISSDNKSIAISLRTLMISLPPDIALRISIQTF